MVPGGGDPCGLIMTRGTGGWELCSSMVWIGCLVVICQMTTNAGVGGVVVIAVMADDAVVSNGNMGSGQHIIVIVDREGGRGPVWVGGVACFAGCRDVDGRMVGVGRCIKIWQVATNAGIGGIDIISLVACIAIVCNRGMGPCERVHIVVVKR